jgi:putative NADH-flavin reductase
MRIAIAGATGRTGSRLLSQAIDRGHDVRALARSLPAGAAPDAQWIEGTIDDLPALRELVAERDVVISAIGPRADRTDACSISTSNLLRAGAARIIVVSGMGVDLPGDRKGLIDKAVALVVRAMAPAVFADKVRELDVLRGSDIQWTAVRVGALVDGATPRACASSVDVPPGFAIDTASLAQFMLDEAESPRYPRAAPFVATR